jgi:hypothetical protein
LLIQIFGVKTKNRGKKKITAQINLLFPFNLVASLELTRIKGLRNLSIYFKLNLKGINVLFWTHKILGRQNRSI